MERDSLRRTNPDGTLKCCIDCSNRYTAECIGCYRVSYAIRRLARFEDLFDSLKTAKDLVDRDRVLKINGTTCRNCGKVMVRNANFCHHCGQRLQ